MTLVNLQATGLQFFQVELPGSSEDNVPRSETLYHTMQNICKASSRINTANKRTLFDINLPRGGVSIDKT